MEWTDTALVLHVGRFRETDMWLRLLSGRRGIFNVFAFGGSRSRRRFCGCLDLLNTVTCRVKSTRNGSYLALQEGLLLHGPQRLRTDWTRLGVAMNCVRFMDVLGVTRDGAPAAFALLEATLTCLEQESAPHSLFPLFFRWRLASDQGFAPSLHVCALCGGPVEQGTFMVDEGQMACSRCEGRRTSNPYVVPLPAAGLDLLRKVQQALPAVWHTTIMGVQERQACARAIDGFVQYHLGIAWEGGRFRRV